MRGGGGEEQTSAVADGAVVERVSVLELLAGEEEALASGRDAELVSQLVLHILDVRPRMHSDTHVRGRQTVAHMDAHDEGVGEGKRRRGEQEEITQLQFATASKSNTSRSVQSTTTKTIRRTRETGWKKTSRKRDTPSGSAFEAESTGEERRRRQRGLLKAAR